MTERKSAERRGQIIPKGNDNYLVKVYIGRDSKGKRQFASKQVAGISAAQRTLTKLLAEKDKGVLIGPSGHTLTAYFQQFMEGKVDVSERTRASYQWIADHYVLPKLGNYRLDKLTPAMIQIHYAALAQQKLSPRSIRYAHVVLRQALQQAVEWGFLVRNPADLVKLPKQEHTEMKVLSPEQVTAFLKWAESSDVHHYPLWCVILLGGLRPQEALALKWNDLDGDTVRITRALTLNVEKQWVIAATKTARGVRAVPLPRRAIDALRNHRAARAKAMIADGYRTEFIFSTNSGNFLSIDNVRRWWKRSLRKASDDKGESLQLPSVKLYGARHSHATLLFALGEHPKAVSERLGHSSIQLTLDTYTHYLPDMQRETLRKLEAM